MKRIIFIIGLVIFSCKPYKNIYERIGSIGLNGLVYEFSDSGNRNIQIAFNMDSILIVSNRTNIAQNHHFLNFQISYSYDMLDLSTIRVNEIVKGNKALRSDGYLKPYDNRQYLLSGEASKQVFPNIEGDTIRFSSDFKRLQIREFCLQKK